MASAKVPDYGAIFMANSSTLNECFERNLVGLPCQYAKFVKEIRAGMILFIFDYEHRKLYGVLKAVTDGKIDIVPKAYSSSGKLFPAQVRFEVIWKCRHPLDEHDFQHAIRDNYYASYRFNFGLSKNQVQDLLLLFLSRNRRIEKAIKESAVNKQRTLNAEKEKKVVEPEASLKPENANCMTEASAKSSLSGNRWIPPEEKPEQTEDIPSQSFPSFDFIPLSSPGYDNLEEAEEAFSVVPVTLIKRDSVCAPSAITPVQETGRPRVKGLYSDSPVDRDSVFSRLVSTSEPVVVAKKKEKKTKTTPSVHEIMEKLEKSRRRWKEKSRRTKRTSPEERDGKMKKRTSVFSRLDFGSKDSVEEGEIIVSDDKSTSRTKEVFGTSKRRKRNREVSMRSQREGLSITIQVQMDGDRYPKKRRACNDKQMEEVVPIMNVNKKKSMEETDRDSENIRSAVGLCSEERWSMFSDEFDQTIQVPSQETSAGKENVQSFEGSTGSNKVDDIVPASLILPALAEDSAANNVGVSPRTILKTYQRRHKSASPIIKPADIEAFLDNIRAECMKSLPGTKKMITQRESIRVSGTSMMIGRE